MTCEYAVTFEFATRAPLTHRGTVAASSAATCASRATRAARQALRPIGWTSLVCVLLGRAAESTPHSRAEGEATAVREEEARLAKPRQREHGKTAPGKRTNTSGNLPPVIKSKSRDKAARVNCLSLVTVTSEGATTGR